VKVVITDATKLDLIGIGDYIRPHNPERAEIFGHDTPTGSNARTKTLGRGQFF
jgi:hypothetical protein